MSHGRLTRLGAAGALASVLWSCAVPGSVVDSRTYLRVGAAGTVDGLAGVLYSVACDDGSHAETYVAIAPFGLPAHLSAALAGAPFADLFTAVPAGTCTVTATAMAAEDVALDGCASATADAVATAGETTELLLVVTCAPKASAAVDIAVVVDQPPLLELVAFEPSNVVDACTPVRIKPRATGTGDVPPSFVISAVGPDGQAAALTVDGSEALLTPKVAGEYAVTVTATDGVTKASTTVPLVARPPPAGTPPCDN